MQIIFHAIILQPTAYSSIYCYGVAVYNIKIRGYIHENRALMPALYSRLICTYTYTHTHLTYIRRSTYKKNANVSNIATITVSTRCYGVI